MTSFGEDKVLIFLPSGYRCPELLYSVPLSLRPGTYSLWIVPPPLNRYGILVGMYIWFVPDTYWALPGKLTAALFSLQGRLF